VQPGYQLEELTDPAGLGQRAVADVVLDVELVVLDPHPLAGRLDRAVRVLEEERRDVGGVARLLEELADVAAPGPFGLLVELQAPDVHRHPAVLGHQEPERSRIEQRHHPAILAGPDPTHKRTPGHPLAPSTPWSRTRSTGSGAAGGPR
jgi:hypothetical protein